MNPSLGLIRRPTRLLLALFAVAIAVLLGLPRAAHADTSGSVSLDQPAYIAHENQGYLTITIVRTGDLNVAEHVGYGVKQQDAQDGIDFDAIGNRYITMAPGQSRYSFNVRIIDQGMNGTPVHALAYLYGSWPDAIGTTNSLVTILHDDPLALRDAANPLGVPGPYAGNLIAGTRLYVDPSSGSAKAAREFAGSRPQWASALRVLADEPGAHRFYMWNMGANVAGQVAHYLEGTQVQEPNTTVMLSTYSLVHDHCGYTATPAMRSAYDNFIGQVAAGIGNFHVIFFLELDSLITTPCLTHAQLPIREAELRDAVTALEADPHALVYLDAGAADAVPAAKMAGYLRASGVRQAQGFFLNSTHFDWTTTELHYGQDISRRLGGVHFIINTGSNGRGPLRPHQRVGHGNEVLCNPPGRGLGPLSVRNGVAQQTAYAGADGLLWFSNPGGSGGACRPGAPPTGVFWPARAVSLALHWVDRVTGPHFALRSSPAASMARLATAPRSARAAHGRAHADHGRARHAHARSTRARPHGRRARPHGRRGRRVSHSRRARPHGRRARRVSHSRRARRLPHARRGR